MGAGFAPNVTHQENRDSGVTEREGTGMWRGVALFGQALPVALSKITFHGERPQTVV